MNTPLEKHLMVLQASAGLYVTYRHLTFTEQTELNRLIRPIEARRWVLHEDLNPMEKAQFKRQFRGGWEHGNKFKDPSEFESRMYHDDLGIPRWSTNDRIPPQDIIALLGLSKELVEAIDAVREEETGRTLDGYRVAQANRTPEQIAEAHAEARAAHGPGVELINVITGDKFTT